MLAGSQWTTLGSPSERRATDFIAPGRFIQSNLPSLMLISPPCSKPLSSKHTHASFLLSPLQARKCRVATKARAHTLNCSALAVPSSFTIMPFPSSQQPTFICSVVNSLAVKLKDWLWCLSSFYLLPWFIFISSVKGRAERASSTIISSETSRSRCRIQRHIISCESHHCFSKTVQHYCTKRDDCRGILWTITVRATDPVTTK